MWNLFGVPLDINAILSVFLAGFHFLIGFFCIFHILSSRKRASATILWILAIIYLPWVGVLLYLVLGINRVERRIEKRQTKRERLSSQAFELFAVHSTEKDEANLQKAWDPAFEEFFCLLDNLAEYEGIGGNKCSLMFGGEEVFSSMEKSIAEAKHSIHLMTYIVDDDVVGRSLFDQMADQAKKGVEVRAIVDGYGSNMFAWKRVGRYRRAGVDLKLLRQFQPFRGRIAINLRNHRKILVCDGKIAFIGGMNISARHLLKNDQKKPVIDYHARVEGPVVGQLQKVFAEDWFDVTSESILKPEYFPNVEPAGEDIVRTVSGGPDDRQHLLLKVFCAAIQTAGKSIRIVTPYFVPDPAILMLLKLAALGGVETTIVVPIANNHPEIKYASRYRYHELMRAGVKIYERNPPFSHSKLFTIDGLWACIGSANWDMRTFHLQFDTNIGVVSREFVEEVDKAIDDEINASVRIEPAEFYPRPKFKGVLERMSSLFEDLL